VLTIGPEIADFMIFQPPIQIRHNYCNLAHATKRKDRDVRATQLQRAICLVS
jgi:hypothetical protein